MRPSSRLGRSPFPLLLGALLSLAAVSSAFGQSAQSSYERCVELARTAPEGSSGLPVPRFVSLRFSEVNVRRGPDRAHEIDWQYTRRGLPIMIVAEHKDWRRVCDSESETGWVHLSQLSGSRTALVVAEDARLRMRGETSARPVAVAKRGALLEIARCDGEWCLLRSDTIAGWMDRRHIWGVMIADSSPSPDQTGE